MVIYAFFVIICNTALGNTALGGSGLCVNEKRDNHLVIQDLFYADSI